MWAIDGELPGKIRSAAAVLLIALSGCAASRSASETQPLMAPDLVLALPQPGDLGRTVEAAQLITIRQGGETHVFEGHISITPEQFQLVGVDGIGRRAITLTWEKSGRIRGETAEWMPNAIPPGPMLADLIVLYWPDVVVRRALEGAGATLVSRHGTRSVLADGVEIFRAEYQGSAGPSWSGNLHYRNNAWGYDIDVQSIELVP